jgi:mannose-6-phosphate isomerase-like protein (cupin superfamily)
LKITVLNNVEFYKNPHNVDARKIYDSKHAQAVHLSLKPGESLRRHITPVDVFFYVLEGKGVVEIGDEKKEVGSDTVIESPAKIVYCWYNQSNEILKILVVKVPRSTESTMIL